MSTFVSCCHLALKISNKKQEEEKDKNTPTFYIFPPGTWEQWDKIALVTEQSFFFFYEGTVITVEKAYLLDIWISKECPAALLGTKK